MEHREEGASTVSTFVDECERRWEVREIREMMLSQRAETLARPEYLAGWLLFSSGTERRRLAPLPPGWRVASERQLRRWCEDASPVKPS